MRRPILYLLSSTLCVSVAWARITVSGPIGPDGKTEVTCDLPVDQRIKNVGSRIDGEGECVYSSCEMALRWANVESMRGFRDWCARKYRGGGWPLKLESLTEAYCKEKGIEVPAYVQYEGRDPAILDLALKTGRMVAVTYGRAHMVDLIHLDSEWACLLDNNAIGDKQLLWMPRPQFLRSWTAGRSGWCVVYLAPPPPPPPKN